ncbi:MAG: c-type cytochrome [Acidimicrobiia bacterium]|nr:c-type cytochrome [Acidimicrobiia bacterium]
MRRLLLAVPLLLAVLAGTASAEGDDDPLGYVVDREDLDEPEVIAEGRELYEVGCVSCHGPDGLGEDAPDIRDQGYAGAHYWITSGRMPAEDDGVAQSDRKDSPYSPGEIEALVAYVGTLGDGPEIPEVDPEAGDLSEGGELFRLNCAACHQAGLAGGALSYGRNAPTLQPVTAVQIAEVLELGPGQMPVFDRLSDDEVDSLIAYIRELQDQDSPGGFSLGRVGPIPEGFVAIVVGTGALLLVTLWIASRRQRTHDGAVTG